MLDTVLLLATHHAGLYTAKHYSEHVQITCSVYQTYAPIDS